MSKPPQLPVALSSTPVQSAGKRTSMSLRPTITILSACHLGFMVLVALYLCAFHSAGEASVWTILCAALVSELMPRQLRQYLVAELLLAVSACICYWWLIPSGSPEAMHAAVGMGFTYLLLIPSSLRRLRYLLSLVILELILLGQRDTGHSFGILELSALPFGIAALAVDGWLVGAVTARSSSRLRQDWGWSLVRWALVPAGIAIAVSLGIGGTVVGQAVASKRDLINRGHHPNGIGPNIEGIDTSIHIGDHKAVQRDPVITARLSWTDGPAPKGLIYLRAAVLSNLHLEGNHLSWTMPSSKALTPAPPPTRTPQRWAWVLRLPGSGDMVMRPDGGDSVDLDGLMTDRDGNLFRARLGDAPRAYRADFDDGQIAADPASAPLYLEVPRELDSLPWDTLEQAHWREVSPERAAELVCQTLRERCSYALDDLPTPAAGPGGVLRTFLFGTQNERRGHCQYFATAAALLLRRAGVQARCVGGFASDELGQQMVIFRALDAHAWLEIVNSKGSWQRVEATPPGVLAQRSQGVDIPEMDGVKDLPKVEQLTPAKELAAQKLKAEEHRTETGAVVIAVLAGLFWWLRRRRSANPRLTELQRQSDTLFRLAASLGIPLGPATTLSNIAEALQARTGIDLTRALDQHLQARFGNGAIPDAWPINELRAAARSRAANPPMHATRDPAKPTADVR